MFKRITSLIVAFAIIFPFPVKADAIYQTENKMPLANGITLTNLSRLDLAGWQNINIIEADLSNPYVQAKILTSAEGLNKLETVKTLSEANDTVAAVNGDFFSWNSSDKSKGSVVGTVMNDGKLLSSSSETDGMFTFAIDEFNKIICESIKTNITLTALNGNAIAIKHLNKYDSLMEPVIYTSDFGGVTGGSFNNILEVVIVDGVVTELRRELEGVSVPENGYVIRHLPEYDPFLVENLAVGDKVDITFDANFNLSDYKTMTGGGTMLVTQGQPAKITHNVSGSNPRTAIACDKTRSKLYLITVDGRQNDAKGYTLPQFTDFLIEIGMYDAMNLDGGGSTTLVTKSNAGQVTQNVPSDGGLRKVASAVGILSTSPKGEVLSGFEIDVEDTKVFAGTSRVFNIKNPVDEYNNPYEENLPEIEWSVDSRYGYFDGNVLYATSQGENVRVSAFYNNIKAEINIEILDNIADLKITPSHIDINEFNESKITVTARNSKGVEAKIEKNDIVVLDKNQFEKIVNVGGTSKSITLSDIKYCFEKGSFSSSGYPSVVKASAEFDSKQFKSGKGSAKLNFDFSGIANSDSGAAYLNLTTPVNVSAAEMLGMWVYSPTILNQWLRAEFEDEDGKVLRQTLCERIDFAGWRYLTFDVPDKAQKLVGLYVVQNSDKEKSEGYLLFDSLSVASKAFEDETINEEFSSHKNGNISFSVVGSMPENNSLLSKVLVANTKSKLKENDYVFSLSNYDFSDLNEIKTNGYSSFVKDKSLFVTLNNSDGYTSAAQWEKFTKDTSGGFENVFIFLNESHKLIQNNNEAQMFDKIIENLSKKSNVFVFYPDWHTSKYYESGALFVSVGNLSFTSPKTATAYMKKMLIPRVDITNGKAELTFNFMY